MAGKPVADDFLIAMTPIEIMPEAISSRYYSDFIVSIRHMQAGLGSMLNIILMEKRCVVPWRLKFVWILWLSTIALPLLAADGTNLLQIQSVSVNDKSLALHHKGFVNLGAYPENIVFGFGPVTNGNKPPLRLRYRLEGFDNAWHEGGAEMALTVRFYNNAGNAKQHHNAHALDHVLHDLFPYHYKGFHGQGIHSSTQ